MKWYSIFALAFSILGILGGASFCLVAFQQANPVIGFVGSLILALSVATLGVVNNFRKFLNGADIDCKSTANRANILYWLTVA